MTRFLAGLLAVVLTGFPQAQAATRYVGTCGAPSSATIAAAMTAASAGDTLLICPGTYSEAVTVSKDNLTIRGSTGNRADVTVSHSGIPFTLSGAGATLKDMTITSSNNAGISRGWASSGSAYAFENLAITAKERGISIDVSAKVTMRNLNVTSTHNDAIYLGSGASGAHEFDTITASAKNVALYVYKGGAVFNDLTLTSSNNYALQIYPNYDATFSDITATASNGGGLYLGWVSSGKTLSFSNISVTAKDKGIYVEVAGKVTMNTVTVSSSHDDAIYLGWSANAAHEFDTLNLTAKGNALYVTRGGALFSNLTLTAEQYAYYGAPSATASFSNITATSSKNAGLYLGWNALTPALSFSNVDVTAKERGLYIEVSGKATFNDVNVTSSHSDAVYLGSSASGAHEFDTMTLSAKEYGLYAYRGGALFQDLTITSSDKDALVMFSDYDAVLDGLALSAPKGYGINMGWARYNRRITITDSEISAKEQGIRIVKSDKVTLNNLTVTSTDDDAIFLGYGASGAHALSNLTLEAEDAGVRLDANLWSASIDNICVNDAEYGVWISQWNARNVSITDSKFDTSGYGIRTDANASYKTIASGNCVLKSSTPRAYSNSTTHAFNGNFWQGVSTSTYRDGNVRDFATLTSCPVSSCYGEASPTPVAPYADWRMDETAWSGAAAEVVDDSGNARHATRVGGAQTAPVGGKLCGAGDFPANSSDASQDAVSTGVDIDTHIGNKGAIAFWYKSDAAWVGGGDRALFDAGRHPYYFFLMLTNSGTLRFGLEDSADLDVRFDSGAQSIAAGVWTHIAVTWDLSADSYRIYLNGSLIKSDSTNSNGYMGTLDTLYIGDNRGTYHPSGTANSASGLIDEFLLFNSVLSDSAIATLYANQNSGLNWDGSARTCPAAETPPAGFNCVETGASASDGPLYTKLAGVDFTFDIVALKADGTVESSYATSGDKTVSVELVDGAGVTDCAGRTTRVTWPSQTFTAANAGRISASAASTANAYANLRCRVSDGTTTGCSTDAFAIRPQGLTLTSAANADATGGDADATPAISTGTTFQLQATAVAGYDGTPAISAGSVQAHTGAVRAGSLDGAFGAASALTGVSSGNFTYDEVGYFRLAALGARDTTFTAVDSGSGDCTDDYSNTAVGGRYGCHFGNAAATAYFGRFIPDHFALTPGDLMHGCGTFTYFGQSFATDFTLAAQNHNNATTQNYTGDFARLGLTDWAAFHFAASGTTLTQGDDAPSGTWSNGVASVTATHRAARAQSGTPDSPADLDVKAAPEDADAVTMAAAAVSTTAPHRFGRLRLFNASGSEYRALRVPLTAQYWNGSGFIANTLDACTTPGAPTLTFYADSTRNKLASGETTATYAHSPLSAGDAGLSLSAPGDNNFGFVDLSVDAPDWLEYVWDSVDQDADSNLFDDDPTARASFGQRASGSKVIIRREMY